MVLGMNRGLPDVGAFSQLFSLAEMAPLGTVLMMAGFAMRRLELPGTPLAPSPTPHYALVYGGGTATGTTFCQLMRLGSFLLIAVCSPRSHELAKKSQTVECFDYHDPDAAVDAIKKLTKGCLKYVFDCIGSVDSARFCFRAIGRMAGHYETVHVPHEAITRTRKTVKSGFTVGLEVTGLAIDIPAPHGRAANPELRKFGVDLAGMLKGLVLHDGKIRPHPLRCTILASREPCTGWRRSRRELSCHIQFVKDSVGRWVGHKGLSVDLLPIPEGTLPQPTQLHTEPPRRTEMHFLRRNKKPDNEAENNAVDNARAAGEEDNIDYPHGLKLALIMTSAYLSMFLVALDRLIVSTAIPKITDEFGAVGDVGWYASAYFMTNCAFQLLFGRLYTFFSVKIIFLIGILIFEVGSAVCGAAPSSVALIVGRAVAGLGSAGIYAGAVVVTVYSVPLEKRTPYQAVVAAIFGLTSVLGPLMGGAFTDSPATWRWCFYINLPIGAVAAVLLALLLQVPDRETTALPLKEKLRRLDGPGCVALLGGIISLLIALRWGGTTYAWSSGRIIALFVVMGVCFIVFIAIQIRVPGRATVPPHIITQRSIAASSFSMFCSGATMMTTLYYLPIWFQGVTGVSAVGSGIRLLPTVVAQVIASFVSGAGIQVFGEYMPFMLVGNAVLCVGTGLLTMLKVDTTRAQWIGYQIPYGAGLGATLQVPLVASQTVLPLPDVPTGTSILIFCQLLGGAIFVSVGQNLFTNELVKRLKGVPGVNVLTLLEQGATQITDNLSDKAKPIVLEAYNASLRQPFICGVILSCLGYLGALGMDWRSIKRIKKTTDTQTAGDSETKERSQESTAGGPLRT
ncbi:HC-toxin efflux carrier TOXA [Fusarium albosuccineum]|uniref:HC-toxin efflux carrier TOXA n=1 Tax=Fusarium albosuccineum TaxID=1237068 RepID=A0A8H4P766_9HYPO|nr:HC-toxin efflux carrier TOXA [Fusarium albosuccineum]